MTIFLIFPNNNFKSLNLADPALEKAILIDRWGKFVLTVDLKSVGGKHKILRFLLWFCVHMIFAFKKNYSKNWRAQCLLRFLSLTSQAPTMRS